MENCREKCENQEDTLQNILTEEEVLKLTGLTKNQLADCRNERRLPFLKINKNCRLYMRCGATTARCASGCSGLSSPGCSPELACRVDGSHGLTKTSGMSAFCGCEVADVWLKQTLKRRSPKSAEFVRWDVTIFSLSSATNDRLWRTRHPSASLAHSRSGGQS